MKIAWLQLFGLVLFSAHVYGPSQLVATCSLMLALFGNFDPNLVIRNFDKDIDRQFNKSFVKV